MKDEPLVLRGRDEELSAVRELVAQARAGQGNTLSVRGEPGIGKTMLLDAAGREAGPDFRVLRVVGIESETELPYAALDQLLRPLRERVARLPERQRHALDSAFGFADETAADRMLVGLAALTLLSEAAEERPILALVDDAQWLDGESLHALGFVFRRLSTESIAAIVASRVDGGNPILVPGSAELVLNPLNDLEARKLLEESSSERLERRHVDAIVRTANGNPLALRELAYNALHDGDTTTSVEQSYLNRIRALPATTQKLLALSSADDDPTLTLIARAAPRVDTSIDDLGAAEREGLVRVSDGTILFLHPLVRSAAYRGATFVERRQLHSALADALDQPEEADRRAWHRAAAAVEADEEIAAALEGSASRALRRGGHAAATAALARSAELSVRPADRARRTIAAAESARLAGQHERALSLLDTADVRATEPKLEVRAARVRGVIEAQSGSPHAAMRIFLDAATRALEFDRDEALELVTLAQESAGLAGDISAIVEFGAVIERWSEGATPSEQIRIGLVRGFTALMRGETSAPRWLSQAVSAGAETDDPRLLVWAGTAAMFLGDESATRRLLGRAVAEGRTRGAVGALPFALHLLAGSERRVGRIAAAEADAHEALQLASETGQDLVVAGALSTLAALASFRGDAEATRDLARRTREIAIPRGLTVQLAGTARALAELELATGRSREALAEVAPLIRDRRSTRDGSSSEPFALFSTPIYIEAAARAEAIDEFVLKQLDAFERWVEAGNPGLGRPLVARCRALVATDAAEIDYRFRAAIDLHAEQRQPFEHARTMLLYGEFLRRARRRTDARELLRQALETFEGLGARLWAERAAAELRATGATARKRDDATRDDLTPQELQIVRLVSQGRTNADVAGQLFLSPKTVQYHLRKVFAKLSIASRTELARLVAQGEIPGAAEVHEAPTG